MSSFRADFGGSPQRHRDGKERVRIMRTRTLLLASLMALVIYSNAFALSMWDNPMIYQDGFKYDARPIGGSMPIIAATGEELQLPGLIEATNWNPTTQTYERQLFPTNWNPSGACPDGTSCTLPHCVVIGTCASLGDTCAACSGGVVYTCCYPTTSTTPPAGKTCYYFCVMSCGGSGADQCVPNMGGVACIRSRILRLGCSQVDGRTYR
jgi:hypothetical protein